MGGELKDQSPEDEVKGGTATVSPSSIAERFEQLCPMYMSMGMPRDEYWNGDVWAVRDYRKAYRETLKAQDHQNWMLGFYVYGALLSAAPAFRDFTKERKARPYLKNPVYVKMEETAETSRKQRMENGKEFFMNFANSFNARFKARQEGGEHHD